MPLVLYIHQGIQAYTPTSQETSMPLTLLIAQHFDSHAFRSIQSLGCLSGESGYDITSGSQNKPLALLCFHTWRNTFSKIIMPP